MKLGMIDYSVLQLYRYDCYYQLLYNLLYSNTILYTINTITIYIFVASGKYLTSVNLTKFAPKAAAQCKMTYNDGHWVI